jgi:hypothetical protein
MKKVLLFLTLTIAGSAVAQSDNVALQGYVSSVDYKSDINSNEFVVDNNSNNEGIVIKTKQRMSQANLYILDARGYVVKRINSINGFKFELNTAQIKPGKYTVRLINGIDKFEQTWVKK